MRFLKLRGLNYHHERPLYAKDEVCIVYIFWVIGWPHERPLHAKGEVCTVYIFWVIGQPHERPLHAKGEVCTVYIFWVFGWPLIWGFIAKFVLWPLRFLNFRGLNNPQKRPLHAKVEVCCSTTLMKEPCIRWSLCSVYLLSNWPTSNLRFHS